MGQKHYSVYGPVPQWSSQAEPQWLERPLHSGQHIVRSHVRHLDGLRQLRSRCCCRRLEALLQWSQPPSRSAPAGNMNCRRCADSAKEVAGLVSLRTALVELHCII
jgi:hypothetical protein